MCTPPENNKALYLVPGNPVDNDLHDGLKENLFLTHLIQKHCDELIGNICLALD